MRTEIIQSIKEMPFFHGTAESDLDAILANSHIATMAKHEQIFLQSDDATSFYIVIDGWVKIYRDTLDGKEAVLAMHGRGDFLGVEVMFNDCKYPFNAEAAEDACLLQIPAEIIRKCSETSPEFNHQMMAVMKDQMDTLLLENEHLSLMTAPQKVGCLLLQFAVNLKGKTRTGQLPYDKSLAATRLGMSAETFSRALSQLKNVGLTVKDSNITINDFDSLINYCCASCSYDPATCKLCKQKECPISI